jgi:hypothetical protein
VISLFVALLFFHYLFDYPLQGDWLSRAKSRFNPIPGAPWYHAMFAHTFMHGAAVMFVTGMWTLGLLEMIVHWITDDLKSRGALTFNQDQAIHIISKLIWGYVAYTVLPAPEVFEAVGAATWMA